MTTNDPDRPTTLPADHPDRRVAADEVHARLPDVLEPPLRASFVAVLVGSDERLLEVAHVGRLCEAFDIPPPGAGVNHFRARFGPVLLKWERHTEFSDYTFLVQGLGPSPFAELPATLLPAGWMAAIPGRTVAAVHAELIPDPAREAPEARHAGVDRVFGRDEVFGSAVGDDAGFVTTDFRIRDDGHVRFVLHDRGLTPRQGGRTLQRLFEIEAYRVMALLALPVVRDLGPRIGHIEVALGSLTAAIADRSGHDETLLGELTTLAADVERIRNATAMRLSASSAYHELVRTRIADLRERRVAGFQTIGDFMTRRLTPAMATCSSMARRLRDLSERVAHANALLSTRVDIVRERQTRAVLESMDRRARLQLRLQRTVEWLSVAAVTYYGAALVAYAAKALHATGLPLEADVAVGVSIPVIAGFVALALHRARLKGERHD